MAHGGPVAKPTSQDRWKSPRLLNFPSPTCLSQLDPIFDYRGQRRICRYHFCTTTPKTKFPFVRNGDIPMYGEKLNINIAFPKNARAGAFRHCFTFRRKFPVRNRLRPSPVNPSRLPNPKHEIPANRASRRLTIGRAGHPTFGTHTQRRIGKFCITKLKRRKKCRRKRKVATNFGTSRA